ncbi:MAG: DUF4340 domain-containing protein [Planctomycetota bacterium]|nr:DUF4340 domain-containing protein [Planctomycetota bacterium]
MNSKTLIAMLLGAGLLWGGTRLLNTESQGSGTSSASQNRLLPDLQKRINQVRRVQIKGTLGTLQFDRNESGQWTVPDRAQYPADRKKLDGLVLAMARSERLEQKTSKPERYQALGLHTDSSDGDRAGFVGLSDGEGNELASLWVGRRRDRSAAEAYFVRLDGDPVCWAASGALALDPDLMNWLENTLIDIPSDQMANVRITHPDGEVVLLGRPKDSGKNTPLSILNLPEGKEPQSEWVTSRFASALQGLKLQDVKPADQANLADGDAVRAEFWTTDNLHVAIESWEQDDLVYVRLHADHSTEGGRLGYQGPEVNGVPSIDLQGGSEAAAGLPKEQVLAEADLLNQRFQGWVYVLPSWKGSALRGRMGELLKAEGDGDDPFGTPGPGTGTAPTEHVMQVESGELTTEDPEPKVDEAPPEEPKSDGESDRSPLFEIDANAVKANKSPGSSSDE